MKSSAPGKGATKCEAETWTQEMWFQNPHYLIVLLHHLWTIAVWFTSGLGGGDDTQGHRALPGSKVTNRHYEMCFSNWVNY